MYLFNEWRRKSVANVHRFFFFSQSGRGRIKNKKKTIISTCAPFFFSCLLINTRPLNWGGVSREKQKKGTIISREDESEMHDVSKIPWPTIITCMYINSAQHFFSPFIFVPIPKKNIEFRTISGQGFPGIQKSIQPKTATKKLFLHQIKTWNFCGRCRVFK